jgi:ribosome-associated translation inhibitor RaiA
MQQALQITFKEIPHSHAIEARIHRHIKKLEQIGGEDIISCHVVIQRLENHPRLPKIYLVEVLVSVPGRQFVANKNPDENIWRAIRRPIEDVCMQLKSYMDKAMHKKFKSHPRLLHGVITRLFEDFGFILGTDQITEYYFNSSHLVWPKFDKLQIGTPVHFIEFIGDDGRQARRISAKRHDVKELPYVKRFVQHREARI